MSNERVSLLVAITVTLVLGGLSAGRFVQASQQDPASPIGSWSIEVRPDPGSPIPPGVTPAAFIRDGILISSNDTGHAGIGSWTKAGPRSYAITFTGLDEIEGVGLPRYIVRSTLELSADSANLDGPFMTDLYAADGTHIGSASGMVHGERLTVLPLP